MPTVSLHGRAFGFDSETGAIVLKPNATRLVKLPDVASGGILAVHPTDAHTHSVRVQSADGTLYYLLATTTITNRTGGA